MSSLNKHPHNSFFLVLLFLSFWFYSGPYSKGSFSHQSSVLSFVGPRAGVQTKTRRVVGYVPLLVLIITLSLTDTMASSVKESS